MQHQQAVQSVVVSSTSSLNARSQKMPSGISSSASLSSCEQNETTRENRTSTPFAVSHRLFSVLCCVPRLALTGGQVQAVCTFDHTTHSQHTADHSRRNQGRRERIECLSSASIASTVSFCTWIACGNLWLLSLAHSFLQYISLCGC